MYKKEKYIYYNNMIYICGYIATASVSCCTTLACFYSTVQQAIIYLYILKKLTSYINSRR